MASVEDRFQAAVNVIKGLPKNGPYQPSTAMMLKFYGLYKQATEGPCHHKRPGFWDVVGKAKWDAWNDNRNLSKSQAMQRYVDGLREIIETMSFTENVQNFVGSISGLDNINLDELDMVVPGMRELAESHPNSPFNSRTNSPQHGTSVNNSSGDEEEVRVSATMNGHATPLLNGGLSSSTDSKNVTNVSHLLAQIKASAAEPAAAPQTTSTYAMSNGTVEQSDDEYGDPVDIQHDLTEAMVHNSELLKQIQATVLRMNADLVSVNQRMGALEKTVQDVRTAMVNKTKSPSSMSGKFSAGDALRAYPKWWPFDDISPAWFVLLVLWPFVFSRLSRALAAPRRK